MVLITKKQAICMFFHKPYTEDNAAILTKKLDDMEDLEICYLDEPTEPVLVHTLTINHNPLRYKVYLSETESPSVLNDESGEEVSLSNTTQLAQFLNIVYVTHDPHNNDVYDLKDISMKQVHKTACYYCDYFDDRTEHSFTKWCLDKKLDLMQHQTKKRRTDRKGKIRTRSLYVVKKKFFDDIVNKISKYERSYI